MSGRNTIFTDTRPRSAAMDWATQPDPFRRYPGADLVRLLLPKPGRPLPYWQLYILGEVSSEPLSLESISLFFRYALSLTAWKRFHETTWSLRANPSSGNLHPTEGYAVLPAIEWLGDAPAVYHYAPKEHGLERRAILDAQAWSELCAPFPSVPSSWASRRSIGGKPGSTASARSAIANTMLGMHLQACALRRRLLAGAWCFSMGSATAPSRVSSGSAAMTTTGRQSVRSLSFWHGSHPVFHLRLRSC